MNSTGECCLGLGGGRCECCKPGQTHVCRFKDKYGVECGAKNQHRSANCPLRRSCRLGCRFCPSGENHYCRKCGAKNHHRSANCPQGDKKSATSTSTLSVGSKTGTGTRTATQVKTKKTSGLTKSSTRPIVTSVAAPAPAPISVPISVRPTILTGSRGTKNGSGITGGNSIVISYKKYRGTYYIYAHLDGVGRYSDKRTHLVIGAGGRNDCGDALLAAEKEDMEEHGVRAGLNYIYVESRGSFHTFIVKCSDADFTGRVTTPQEVINDRDYLKRHFPSARSTNIPTTWSIPLGDLLNASTSLVYAPFRDTLRRLVSAGYFI